MDCLLLFCGANLWTVFSVKSNAIKCEKFVTNAICSPEYADNKNVILSLAAIKQNSPNHLPQQPMDGLEQNFQYLLIGFS